MSSLSGSSSNSDLSRKIKPPSDFELREYAELKEDNPTLNAYNSTPIPKLKERLDDICSSGSDNSEDSNSDADDKMQSTMLSPVNVVMGANRSFPAACHAPSRVSQDCQPSLLDYDIEAGVPVRVIRPDRVFSCHAFSKDGELLATGDTSGKLKIWRTADYSLMGTVCNVHAFQLCFVNGVSQWLRILDCRNREYSVFDLKIKRPNDGAACQEWNLEDLEVTPRKTISTNDGIHADFSEDGHSLMIHKQRCSIEVHRFEGNAHHQCELLDPQQLRGPAVGLRVPLLSPDGQSVLAVYAKQLVMSQDVSATIAVWPTLTFDEHCTVEAMTITGNRAIWMEAGKKLAAWDEEQGMPRLSVYETKNLRMDNNGLLASRTLGEGCACWHAIGCHHSNHALLFEAYKSGKQRFLQWDTNTDTVINEIPTFWPSEVASEEAEFVEPTLFRDTPQSQFYTVDPNKQWSGYLHRMCRSCTIASCSSGATVFNCKLPEHLHFDSLTFDPSGRHFLVIGRKRILAFAPAFLKCSSTQQCRTVHIPDEALLHGSDVSIQDAFHTLHSRALAEACNASNEMLSVLHEADVTARRYHKMALSSDGRWAAWIGLIAEESGTLSTTIAGLLHSRNSAESQTRYEMECVPLHDFYPSHVFVSPCDNGCDRVVFVMGKKRRPELLMCDVSRQGKLGKMKRVTFDMLHCYSVCQTSDRRHLMILEAAGVCRVNLVEMTSHRLSYTLNFWRLFQFGKGVVGGDRGWMAGMENHQRISDDGLTVLLGWDTQNKRSILVTPSTEQRACQAAIRAAREISPLCQLTRDGSCTLFVDVNQLSNGRLVVGIYANADSKIRSTVLVAGDIAPLHRTHQTILMDNCLFYDVKNDGSEILTLTIPDDALENHDVSLEREIKKFSIYGTEESIPEYSRLCSGCESATEKIQELSESFGSGSVFNHPVSDGMSIFQEAYLKSDGEMVQGIVQTAKDQELKLSAQWLPFHADEPKDLLTSSLHMGMIHKAEEAINLMTSSVCPYREAARLWGHNFVAALRLAPHRFIKALVNDEFVNELSHLEVNASFLDPVARRDKAPHIGTLNELHPWMLEEDPATLASMWRTVKSETTEAMEKEGKTSKAMASLKVLCIEGACRPGHQGLIRHLLLKRVPEWVFRSRAVKWIVSHKWFNIWRKKFMKRAFWHGGYLLCLTAYSMLIGSVSDLDDASMSIRVCSSILLFVVWMYGIMTTMEETKQIQSLMDEGSTTQHNTWWGVGYYFGSKWNWLDTGSCLLRSAVIPPFHFIALFISDCNPVLSAVVAVEVLLAYIKVWYFAQPFRVTGALVLMIEQIVRDCLAFLALALNVLLGFALALHVMTRSITSGDNKNAEVAEAFGSFRRSILSLFYALFGDFDSDVYIADHDLWWMTLITFVIYMIAQIIVMLNLLISIMADTFDRVKSNEEGQMLLARAKIIDSCEASANTREIDEIMKKTGRYIYAVERVSETEDVAHGTWFGRINMLIENFKEIIAKSAASTKETITSLVNTLKTETATAHERVESAAIAIRDETVALRAELTGNLGNAQSVTRLVNTLRTETAVARERVERAANEIKGETMELRAELMENLGIVKEDIAPSEEAMASLGDKINQQDRRITDLGNQLQQHATEQASVTARFEERMEQTTQDVSAKLDRILSDLEQLRGG